MLAPCACQIYTAALPFAWAVGKVTIVRVDNQICQLKFKHPLMRINAQELAVSDEIVVIGASDARTGR